MDKTKTKKTRHIDKLAADVSARTQNSFTYIYKKKINTGKALFVLAFVVGAVFSTILIRQNSLENQSRAETIGHLMDRMKKYGCIADGILTGSGNDTENSISLIERSRCEYLHRSIETWAMPPDFTLVRRNMNKIEKNDLIYGMFLAEAIGVNSQYYYPDEGRNFEFHAMCRKGSEGFWGDGTCKAYFGSVEYRKYLRYITRKAIDMGVQSFMFGQVFFQDNDNLSESWAKEIVSEMRTYAQSEGKFIVVGAQTNNITDKKYLKNFDYIEGGVGIDNQGNIEDGPCFSRWWKKPGDRCWALLWHKEFSKKANNVLLHLDWSGLDYDDMSRFARMNRETRAKTLDNLYKYFTKNDMGFLMPYLAVVYKDNRGCFGPNREFYSPDNRYSCKDEDAINAIFAGKKIGNDAEFISQSVPLKMEIGNEYEVSVKFKNTGTEIWTNNDEYRLGSQNPQDNNNWQIRADLNSGDSIMPGEEKTFVFVVKAPSVAGTYNFQWRMVQEKVEWFGDATDNVPIQVNAPI